MDEYQNFLELVELEEIKDYLDLGSDINYKNSKGMTLLLKAIIDKDLKRISFLLEHGANPNILRGDISYLLNATVVADDIYELNRYIPKTPQEEKQCFDTITLLLHYGANLELENSQKGTVLNNTAMRGDLIMSQFLILQGADYQKINWQDNSGDFSPIKDELLEFVKNIELQKKLNSEIKIHNQSTQKESKL